LEINVIGFSFVTDVPKGTTLFPDQGTYEYFQSRVSLCLLCL